MINDAAALADADAELAEYFLDVHSPEPYLWFSLEEPEHAH
jgi:hypothetical protein